MKNQQFRPTGLAILDRPLSLEGATVYGVIYDKDMEKDYEETISELQFYITYLVGAEQFMKNGGCISGDLKQWSIPDCHISVTFNSGFCTLLHTLMNGLVGYKTIEFDTPIEWENGEVDKDVPTLVVSKSLIEKYADTK